MRTKLVVIGLLLCCLVVGLGARLQSEKERWEYRTEETFTTESANRLGLQGWEIVTAVPKTNVPYDLRYIYKRAR